MRTSGATRTGKPMRRLFFALVPPPVIARQLESYAEALRVDCGGRVVPAERMHMTLAFLGATPSDRIDGIIAAASRVGEYAFRVVLDRAGGFRRTRVAWAGCADGTDASRLAGVLREQLAKAGCPLEARAFVPHVTLLRDICRTVPSTARLKVSWSADAFLLMESVHREAKLEYRPIHRIPLHTPRSSL